MHDEVGWTSFDTIKGDEGLSVAMSIVNTKSRPTRVNPNLAQDHQAPWPDCLQIYLLGNKTINNYTSGSTMQKRSSTADDETGTISAKFQGTHDVVSQASASSSTEPQCDIVGQPAQKPTKGELDERMKCMMLARQAHKAIDSEMLDFKIVHQKASQNDFASSKLLGFFRV